MGKVFSRMRTAVDDVANVVAEMGAVMAAMPHAADTADRLPPITEELAHARSERARGWLARLDSARSHPTAISSVHVALARHHALRMAHEGDWYWLVHDPMGFGFFGMFGPTAYAGGWYLNRSFALLGRHLFDREDAYDRYLVLVGDVGAQIRSWGERTAGQAERGIVIPAPQLRNALGILGRLRSTAPDSVAVGPSRYSGLERGDRFVADLDDRVRRDLLPAIDEVLALLEGDYRHLARETVGLSQYAGGEEVYRELVRAHTNLDLEPEEIHRIGVERIEESRSSMGRIRLELGLPDSAAEFAHALASDPRWGASDAERVAAEYRACAERIAPRLPEWFRSLPAAPSEAVPLADDLTESMTFGFYSPSGEAAPGRYYFNMRNYEGSHLANVAALTFHELEPGHHLQLAWHRESSGLPDLARHGVINAYCEGWAEYAATLAGEHGLYEHPVERYGRYMNEAFLTSRLVVDTGMNLLGWSLERAREYMTENAFLSAKQIESEIVRYSCDCPAQALAYKLGDAFLIEQRERMRAALGERFDIRDFHDAVLASGALPLPLVGVQVDEAIERLGG